MIPVGYLYKYVRRRPEWLEAEAVKDIYSVSGCISEDFADYVSYWKHNGYWFFDEPEVMEALARENGFAISECTLFYYEVYEFEYDEIKRIWLKFPKEEAFQTNVRMPEDPELQGYDIVSFSAHAGAECSPLSCNSMAGEISVNEHCLLSTFELAKGLLESGKLNQCEPGPYRIYAVYRSGTDSKYRRRS